ncbi:MAG: hypothetical protein JXA99_08720 [Candidatus Lokiarchaeota archaeon]|nr:hypothetical protein [Candidatus Lokiarchaeota archaeon]
MDIPNIFKNNSNKEIAEIIYNEFKKEKNLNENNIRHKIDLFEKEFWLDNQVNFETLTSNLEERQWEIEEIV